MNVPNAARLLLLVQTGMIGAAAAVPPDQPPVGLAVSTPNNYFVRSGIDAPHFVSESRLKQFARAIDRSGSSANGNPLGYHGGFLGRGFATPYFSDSNADVVFWACADNPGGYDCDNGKAPLDQIIMPTDVYGQASESCVRGILGHELFHHVEFGYTQAGGGGDAGCGGVFGNTACEGQARALQDKFYWDLDLNPAASCVATFRGQVDGYLGAPDVTIWNASYGAALFWTYLMEQYGEVASEPDRGVDFLVDWWDFAQASVAAPNIYQITEDAIRVDHPDHSVLGAYHDFLIANMAKDLDLSTESAPFRARYSYRDEEPVAGMTNLMQFQAVAMPADLVVPNGGSATSNVSARRFGAEYRRFDVSACPAGRLIEFSAAPAALSASIGGGSQQAVAQDAMLALVPVRGGPQGQPAGLYKQRAKAWKQTIPQPASPYSHLLVATAGWHTLYEGALTVRCKAPPPPASLGLISAALPATSGAAGSIGELTVEVTDPDAPFGAIDTLAAPAFGVQVGLLLPAVQKVREAAARHRLIFPYPDLPLGTVDAAVSVGAQTTVIADGIRIAPHRPEFVFAIDASASMGTATAGASKLSAARDAVRYWLDTLPAASRAGLITYAGDGSAAAGNTSLRTALGTLDAAQRSALNAQLAAVTPSAALRVKLSDVLVSSIAQFETNGGGGERHLVLFTDSADDTADIAALAAQARGAGVRLHAILLDRGADQPLHASLAQQTGGTFAFADAGTQPPVPLLIPAVQSAREAGRRSQCSGSTQSSATAGAPAVFSLPVPAAVEASTGGGPRVKVFSGVTSGAFAGARLYRPDGSQAVPGAGVELLTGPTSFAFQVSDGAAGDWRLEVDAPSAGGAPLQVFANSEVVDPGRSLRLAFATPAGTPAPRDVFEVGDAVLVQLAVVDFIDPPTNGRADAVIEAGGRTFRLSLNDAGENGDEASGDRVYSAIFRSTDGGSRSGYDDDGAIASAAGVYSVEGRLEYGGGFGPTVLRERGQFTVSLPASTPDADADSLPDRYEATHACLMPATADAALDPDGDGATNSAEYSSGSDPCNVDSDGGGEIDGSEIARGGRPLDATDDAIRPLRNLEIVTTRSDHEDGGNLPALAHTLRYDADGGYAQLTVKRASSPAGPFVDYRALSGPEIDGVLVDSGLTAGQTYCYQLAGRTANGAVGAASDIVCGTARIDNTAPLGSVILDDGAPRTTHGLLSAKLSIDGEPATGMQMKLRYPDGSTSGWIAYAPFAPIDASAIAAPATLTVAVVFRDAAGNESTVYVDDIDRVDGAATGGLFGVVRAQASGLPIAGATISPSVDSEAPVTSQGNGGFSFDAIVPGSYTLVIEAPGYAPLTVTDVAVAASGVVNVGIVYLQGMALFADGFESD